MSGGSMDYFSFKLEEYAHELKDKELVQLALDLANVFHEREWYDSGDTGEDDWDNAVAEFKGKWNIGK